MCYAQAAPGALRIVVAGDSVAAGAGARLCIVS